MTTHPQWLALGFPNLGLELRWRSGGDPLPAQALIDTRGSARTIVAVNQAANHAGVRPGQSQVHAQSLLSQLRLYPADPQAEANALAQLAAWAYRYSAEVCLDAGLIGLEVGASARLFGGVASLLGCIRDDLRQLGFSAVGGLGRSLTAATLRSQLAQFGRISCALSDSARVDRLPALNGTPVELLPLERRTIEILQGSGISRLGELIKISEAALRRRFGAALVTYLGRLRSTAPENNERYQPPQGYQATLELPAPTELGEALWFPIKRLINDLCWTLQARDLAVDQLELQFELERADRSGEWLNRSEPMIGAAPSGNRLQCQLLEASRDPTHLFELCRQRLERLALDGKVLSIHLQVHRLPPPQVLQEDLFDSSAREQGDWSRLLERLAVRLGEGSLRRLVEAADLRPERAATSSPIAGPAKRSVGKTAHPAPLRGDLAVRPSWLLASPQPIAEGEFQLLSDGERIEGGWWDGNDVRRDYFRALHVNGGQCWVYRSLRPPHGWFLHGWFG